MEAPNNQTAIEIPELKDEINSNYVVEVPEEINSAPAEETLSSDTVLSTEPETKQMAGFQSLGGKYAFGERRFVPNQNRPHSKQPEK
ncbi:hypothetical protein MIS45_01905 [Wielerella bovis]|uniref:hypothetical protein n=1 Tax=Wielerella bovis TaxID=2917790 RepID=UPI002018B318|nr:hypothetical protein [Wielerella bovis]ULJ69635.1 hypothetical protein MIS45_01905 [Wielerella bovis]